MKISVCMATYNGQKYIKEQIDSILMQLGENDELIISDDNSTDNTPSIVLAYNDKRIKFFTNEKERGYTRNFENALEKATGDTIFLSDQDDVWMPNKVKKITQLLQECDFVVSDNTIVDENLHTLEPSHFKIHNVQVGFLKNLLLPRYVGACMAFNRNVLDQCLPFPSNAKLSAHDYWISLVAELNFKVKLLNEPMILYRRHSANASTGGVKSRNSFWHKIKVRIYTLTWLFMRYFR